MCYEQINKYHIISFNATMWSLSWSPLLIAQTQRKLVRYLLLTE